MVHLAVVGSGAAVLGALAAALQLPPAEIVASTILAGTMGAVAAEDFRRFRVPDALSLFAAATGLLSAWLNAGPEELAAALGGAVLGGLLCGGALWLMREAFFRLRRVDGLGFGDVKLAAAGGIWLGWELFATALLLASIGALAFVAARTAVEGAWPRARRIPFALYLAPAIWLTWYGAKVLTG